MAKAQKQSFLAPGVTRFGRHHSATKRVARILKAKKAGKAEEKKQEVKVREQKWYSAEDKASPIPSRKSHHKQTRLRSSITPGTVLIVLAGRFRGKRVVFLKQLPSGLLLVTGPFKINGVPLRRVNQAYVIATSTKVDVAKVDVAKIDDNLFKRVYEKKGKTEVIASEQKKKLPEVSAARKEAQKAVDTVLLESVAKTPLLKQYLGSRFSLTNGQRPHLLKF